MKFEFSKDQEITYSILRDTRDNVFLTGGAGTGKSFVLTTYIDYLRGNTSSFDFGLKYPVLSSTGVSAMLIGGRTFHSYFGLGMASGHREYLVKKSVLNPYVNKRITEAVTIFIDEISMLPANLISIADEICRKIKGKDKPFGGIRVIASGDYLQLPPVTRGEKTDWAFNSMTWNDLDFKNCLLKIVHRTEDFDFSTTLNKVRLGIYDMDVYNMLKERVIPVEEIEKFEGTRLFPFRNIVSETNIRRLSEIEGKEHVFDTEYKGEPEYKEATLKSCPVDPKLVLKEDALVMFRINDKSGIYVNGTLGKVREIRENGTVRVGILDSDIAVTVEKHQFEYLSGSGKVLGTAINYPLSLAWASTIHKSQGATIDKVLVDLRGAWEGGQSYVALSRVKSKEGLNIIGWDNESITVNKEAIGFYDCMKNHIDDYEYVDEVSNNSEESEVNNLYYFVDYKNKDSGLGQSK